MLNQEILLVKEKYIAGIRHYRLRTSSQLASNSSSDNYKMKTYYSLLFCLLPLTGFTQTAKTSKLTVAISDCRTSNPYSGISADTVSFFKLPEGTLAFSIIPGKQRELPIHFDSILISEYKINYKNNFKQHATILANVTGQEKQVIRICLDELSEYPQNTLTRLNNSDTISIAFHSLGCFGGDDERIVITKMQDQFIATIYYMDRKYIKTKKGIYFDKEKAVSTSTVLTNKNISDFIRFENELNFARDGGCTTTDNYVIRSKYLNIEKTDGSCTWDGFYALRRSFFGKK
jgi:hypothetical protein